MERRFQFRDLLLIPLAVILGIVGGVGSVIADIFAYRGVDPVGTPDPNDE